jgi:hypothetical protein
MKNVSVEFPSTDPLYFRLFYKKNGVWLNIAVITSCIMTMKYLARFDGVEW